ncbi:MAG: NAD(+) synthase, partial [Rubripirellula sp.]
LGQHLVPFGTDLLFEWGQAIIGVEICEDLWGPLPPSGHAALAGANVLLNLSSSNETIGKADWRRDLVRVQSGRCIAAYAYASSGAGESTSDLVFGGHSLIAENGRMLAESRRIGDGLEPVHFQSSRVTCDIDLQRLARDRRAIGTFGDASRQQLERYRRVILPTSRPAQALAVDGSVACPDQEKRKRKLLRSVEPHPFVPSNDQELDARCSEILAIQTAGLAKRLSRLSKTTKLSIGVSGGLDSTLALLVAVQACDAVNWSRDRILAMVMPGFGTTEHTRQSADRLIGQLGVEFDCVDIRSQCVEAFRSIGHQPFGISLEDFQDIDSLQARLTKLPDNAADLVFENVQARLRTMLLMTRGFVVGTGDMSEQALGWSTYNADHMSMYNVNTSVPKTLVRFLVRYYASRHAGTKLAEVLERIADTPISPELLPPTVSGEIRQSTESSVGPYELHDFFLYHFIRHGFSREKIFYLANQATFDLEYTSDVISETLDGFYKRFFANQFKRNCVPDGPKIGSVSLSPRGDWRMPSDADHDSF